MTETFPLLKLPLIALRKVLRSMDIQQQVSIADMSLMLENVMRGLKIQMPEYRMRRLDDSFTACWFQITKPDDPPLYTSFDSEKEKTRRRRRHRRHRHTDGYTFGWRYRQNERAFRNLAWLQSIFPGHVVWLIDVTLVSLEELKHLVTHERFRKCDVMNVRNNPINLDWLTFLLDNVDFQYSIQIDSYIPDDYRHPAPFRAQICHHHFGEWIQLDTILALNRPTSRVEEIRLNTSNFDCSDANRFLKHWVESEVETLEMFDFMFRDGATWSERILLRKLMIIELTGSQFLIMTRRKPDPSKPWNSFGLFYYTRFPEGADGGGFAFHVTTEDEYDADWEYMRTIHKKKDLENELDDIDEKLTLNEMTLSRTAWRSNEEFRLDIANEDLKERKKEARRELHETTLILMEKIEFQPDGRAKFIVDATVEDVLAD